MAPTLYNVFDSSEAPVKEKKPRSAAQIAAFEKAKAALLLKRSAPKAPKEAQKVEEPIITDENEAPVWFKNYVREARERQLQQKTTKTVNTGGVRKDANTAETVEAVNTGGFQKVQDAIKLEEVVQAERGVADARGIQKGSPVRENSSESRLHPNRKESRKESPLKKKSRIFPGRIF